MMPAPRFIMLWLGTVALLATGALPLADALFLAWPEDAEAAWVRGIWARKLALAAQLPPLHEATPHGGRILIVGGSSGLFSFDAELLEARLGRPVMNLGTHAGLGLRHLLADAREVARPGDFVLLALENSHYRSSGDRLIEPLEEKMVWTHLGGRLRELSWPMLLNELYGHPLQDYAEGWRRRNEAMAPQTSPKPPPQYSEAELSPRGDYRGRATFIDPNLAPLALLPLKAVNREAAEDLRQFFAWCRGRGVSAAAVLPPLLRRGPGDLQNGMEPAVASFLTRAGIPLLHLAGAQTLPRELMLDWVLHANTAGRRILTELLARELGAPAPATDAPWLLVASRDAVLGRELVLAKEGVAGCLYLSAQKLESPVCITPEEVRAQMQNGRRFAFADPEIPPLLARANLAGRTIATKTATPSQWTDTYKRAVFLFARAAGSTGKVPLPAFLPAPDDPARSRVAIVRIGPSGCQRLEADSDSTAELRLSETDPWESSFRFRLALSARADAKEGALVTVGHVPLAEEEPGGWHVAVFDPETGLLVKHAAFTGPELTEWELREVVLPP